MGSILLILDKGCVLPMLSKGFILSILDSMLFIAAASAMPLMAKARRVNEVNKRYPMMIGEVLVNQKTCAQTASPVSQIYTRQNMYSLANIYRLLLL